MSSSFQNEMRVTKRNGELETVEFDKILKRVKTIGKENGLNINYTALVMKVIDQLYDKISTTKLDELSAEQCASMSSIHTDYNILAGHIIISNHQKNTLNSFVEVADKLFNYKNNKNMVSPLVSKELYEITKKYGKEIDDICDYSRDYFIDYFGFKTLEKSYLIKMNGKPIERPQHMWLRVAIGIHGDNMERIKETYYYLSNKYFTHATPTLFNAGTNYPQLSSCFLYSMESDSIEGVYNTLKDCALISKWAGGIGLHIHNIRASGSHIRGTNGTSNGIVPMLRVFNNTAKYVDQCLNPDTIVFTKKGPIEIKKTVIGDKIISDDGNFYKIKKILNSQYQGDMYSLKTQNSIFPLKATDMHPLLMLKNINNNTDFDDIKNQLKINLIRPDFVEIKNIDQNDFIGFSSPKYEKDILEYSEDDCRMYGILLGSTDEIFNNEKDNMEVYLNFDNKINKKTIKFVQNYLDEKFILYDFNNCDKIKWKRTNMFKFTNEMIYDENNKKHIIQQILHLPQAKLLRFILGFLETKYFVENNDGILLKTINSKKLVYELIYIFMRLNMLIKTDFLNDSFHLIIPKTKTICHLLNENLEKNNIFIPSEKLSFFEHDGILYDKVIENNLIQNINERVIDIEIDDENHHNFLTENGIVHNGGGKRNGSIAIYLENWHADIELFLEMRKNHGDEELKARDLFYALWISDLFMERVKENAQWSLMCPDECPGLSDVYGDEFVKLYTRYENEGRARVKINARDLWFKILDAQMETGTPYILYKDAVNRKSNQKNIGIIKSSNLCTEITEYSDKDETAVCNLASIALPTFLDTSCSPPVFNYEKLHEITKVVTYNLNRIIDVNFYPILKAKISNMRHRPIGIGVQGLADVFMLLDIPFYSKEAIDVNKKIFETIYHASLECSNELAEKEGFYETFPGSPTSKGILQFDLWGIDPSNERYNWDELKEKIIKNGLRNSLLVAPMPTASTSQILGFNECVEPITSNIYSRRTIAGEFILMNKYLMKDLMKLGLWNEKIKNNIIANNGSIQQIDTIPTEIKNKYKTVWEIPMRHLIDMAADRGSYICQSQSLNLWLEEPDYSTLTSMHFYSWKKGLKTGIYYLRRRARHRAQQFTIEPEKKNNEDNYEICEMCSS